MRNFRAMTLVYIFAKTLRFSAKVLCHTAKSFAKITRKIARLWHFSQKVNPLINWRKLSIINQSYAEIAKILHIFAKITRLFAIHM